MATASLALALPSMTAGRIARTSSSLVRIQVRADCLSTSIGGANSDGASIDGASTDRASTDGASTDGASNGDASTDGASVAN
jgi:hypothetical protein